MRIRRVVVAVAATLALAVAGLPAAVAHAAPDVAVTESASGGDGRHCAIGVDPVDLGTPADAAPAPSETCFDTFSDAIAHATDGEVRLPTDSTPTDGGLDRALRDSDSDMVVLGIEYDGAVYGGQSKVIFGTGDGCYAGKIYWVRDLRDIDFNNRISSARMYSNCLGRHYDGINGEGLSFLCESSCPGMGTLNNRSSSIKYF